MVKNIGMKKNIRSGYFTVDAAIFLPVFLIAVLTLAFFIKVVGSVEISMHGITDETRLLAARAYDNNPPVLFKSRLESRLAGECKSVKDVRVQNFQYLSENGEISFDTKFHIDFRLPIDFWKGMDVKERVLSRGWIGKSGGKPFGFDRMERDEASETVYIFPNQGKRYHKKSCIYVTAHATQMVLTGHLKKHYKACLKCRSGKLKKGSIVFYFLKYGEAYHRGNCKAIDKYTVTLEKTQAESRGYTPCGKCGGI